jgi:CBS domain-containing protein
VKLVMRPAPLILSAQNTVQEALREVKDSSLEAWPVAAQRGLAGMIRRTDLANAIAREAGGITLGTLLGDSGLEAELPAGSSASNAFVHLHPDHSLHLALERMGSSGFGVLPVVSRASVRQLMGIVVLDDVLKAYGVVGQTPAATTSAPASGD